MKLFKTRDFGHQIEKNALDFLRRHKLSLITQNYHCRHGEIDLIMQDQGTLVFVEVRFRKNADYGSALDSVNYTKQQRIIHTAMHYLQLHPHHGPCRFDVVGVSKPTKQFHFNWVKNAFQC